MFHHPTNILGKIPRDGLSPTPGRQIMLLLRTNQQFYIDVCATDSLPFPITNLVSFARGTGVRKPNRVVPTRETSLCVIGLP
jgi:hypothetical protein